MEKINIAELLKDCPKGMELDSPLCGDCKLYDVNDYGIRIESPNKDTLISLYHDGRYHVDGEIMIFPKGKTSWDNFIPPYKFKDGDIVCVKTAIFEHIFIFKTNIDARFVEGYVTLSDSSLYLDGYPVCEANDVKEIRLATEEEKVKLFDTIKARGYKWNNETKTLEKLIEPIFKAGNKVRNKNNHNIVFTITSLEEDCYVCGTCKALWFDDQDKYELVPDKFDINTLKLFDKVLVRDSDKNRWDIQFYELYDDTNVSYPYRTLGGMIYKQCIPYEGNEHLVGLIKNCDNYYKTWND